MLRSCLRTLAVILASDSFNGLMDSPLIALGIFLSFIQSLFQGCQDKNTGQQITTAKQQQTFKRERGGETETQREAETGSP